MIIDVRIENRDELFAFLDRLVEATSDGSEQFRKTELEMAERGRELAADVSPVLSGTLASAHVAQARKGGGAVVFISPTVAGPRGARPAVYGPIVHAMGGRSPSGGERAFYQHVQQAGGRDIAQSGARSLVQQLGRLD